MTTLYGIKNCDTVKKACKWLDAEKQPYTFHDFRADGLTAAQVQGWVAALGWETLTNKRSTTWKQLSDAEKASLNDETIVAVILANPTLIKRPLLDHKGEISVGFKDADYSQKFSA